MGVEGTDGKLGLDTRSIRGKARDDYGKKVE